MLQHSEIDYSFTAKTKLKQLSVENNASSSFIAKRQSTFFSYTLPNDILNLIVL